MATVEVTPSPNEVHDNAYRLMISAPHVRDASTKREREQFLRLFASGVEQILAITTSDGLRNITKQLQASFHASLEVEKDDRIAALIREFTPNTAAMSDAERIQVRMAALLRSFRNRQQLLEGALTATEVAKLLGVSRQTPHDRVKSKTLLAVTENGVLRFPLWQFDPNGSDGVVEGLPQVLRALHVEPMTRIYWLRRPNVHLNGRTPIEALKKGAVEETVAEAETVGRS